LQGRYAKKLKIFRVCQQAKDLEELMFQFKCPCHLLYNQEQLTLEIKSKGT
jgi:hypothetical protein